MTLEAMNNAVEGNVNSTFVALSNEFSRLDDETLLEGADERALHLLRRSLVYWPSYKSGYGYVTSSEKPDEVNDAKSAVKEIDSEIGTLKDKKLEADEYADQKEKIIDNALLFIKDPSEFWNRAPVQIQKRVQLTIFPESLVYDFEKGFGIVKVNEPYQLIKKIAPEGAKNSIVVAGTRLAHILRAQNFRQSNKLLGEGSLANCHWQFSLLTFFGYSFKLKCHQDKNPTEVGLIFW